MDLVGTATAVSNTADDIKKNVVNPLMQVKKATSKTSIMRLTKDQVFNFPLIIDADIDDDEKFPLIKSIEKNYASIVLMAIVNEGVVDRDKYDSINQFLKKFHNNDDIPFNTLGVESDITVSEAIASEGYMPEKSLYEMWDCVEEQLDTESINNMYLPYQRTVAKLSRAIEAANQVAMEAESSDMYFRRTVYKKGKKGEKNVISGFLTDGHGNRIIETDKDGSPVYQYIELNKDADSDQIEKMTSLYGEPKKLSDWHDTNISQRIADSEAMKVIEREDKLAEKLAKDAKDIEDKRLKTIERQTGSMQSDSKFNILTPTILKITLANAKTATSWTQDLIIGIRAMPRLLPQSLLIANMVEAFKDRAIFKFIKWTKGEIKWADLLFGIGSSRNNAIVKSDSRWLKVLKKRAKRANARWFGYKLNPNTTIIITEADAHLIQEKCGVDPHSVSAVAKMMNKYFLLGFGIYDTEGKVLSIIYDGETEFTNHSMRSMIADSKKEANLLTMGKY